jgi:NADH dehydrogenase [ubiquinone] 1 alpha subcomplex assembly factor 7
MPAAGSQSTMDTLRDVIKAHIRHQGPMDLETFWTLCLAHPQFGYYITRDPLGRGGDFTTAPEISQLFGEMIGVFVADFWLRIGSPAKFYLTECGPGRGSLMADMLRATAHVNGFHQAAHIHLIETSPALRAKQKEKLSAYEVMWHDDLSGVPDDAPVVIIGNEFLDALPIRQAVFQDGVWHERRVGLDGDKLVFGLGGAVTGENIPPGKDGDIFEFSPVRRAVWVNMCERVHAQGGTALMIDYGHVHTGVGDTFQAVKGHAFVDVLDHPGEADVTSHVDFSELKDIAEKKGLSVLGPFEQGDFLRQMGIEIRAKMLAQKSSPDKAEEILAGLRRLTARDQMGSLFKVIGVYENVVFSPSPLIPLPHR